MQTEPNVNMEIDSLCNSLSGFKVLDYLNIRLINDINIIIREIANMKTLNVDIYEVCVSCGNNVVWDQEYQITLQDVEWLNKEGKIYFLNTLNSFFSITNTKDYELALKIYSEVVELFTKSV